MLRLICIATGLSIFAATTMPEVKACVVVREPNPAYIQSAERIVPPGARDLFNAGQAVEGRDIHAALALYARAAKAGDGRAALRLGDIYYKGAAGVPRDYAESLKWDNVARTLGALKPVAC